MTPLADLIRPFTPADGGPPRSLMAFMRWALKGSMGVIVVAGLVSALVGTMEVVSAAVLGWLIDGALVSGPDAVFSEQLGLIVFAALFFVLLRPIAFGASAAANAIVIQPNVFPLILSRINRYTLGQSVTYFDNDFAGRIAQKQMQTARAATEVVSEIVNTILFALASIIGAGVLLLGIDWRVALSLIVWLVVYFALIGWFMPRIRLRSKDRAAARAMVSGQIVDTITNIKTVKLFGHSEHEDGAALETMDRYRTDAISFGRLSSAFRLCLMAVAGFLPVLLIGGTLWLWSLGGASAGDIAATGAIAIRIAQMTGWVSFTLMGIYANVGEIEDGIRTLTPPHALTDKPDARPLPPVRGLVEFDDVTFTYGRGPGAGGGLKNISLTLHEGEKVGLVGASGAGKSTLVSLLLRLYDTEQGEIRIDGHDVRDVTQESLRKQISMVTQETAMFNRSARDNLLYGRPGAGEENMVEAADRAEAHSFIGDLRDFKGRSGYEAHLGERGVRLSGGQRQRIALARAILKDAPILVLDEATSALDSEVEAQIQTALERVMENKTVLAIAHRLSTIAHMDRIVVMEEGRIVEQGTHTELLRLGGVYAGFWEKQSGGFLGLDAAE
ncbi:ABC transporter ATP-binding protein [Tropicimonas sp. IMCC34011]|uniref:ABC transporter ATP-binding protein n=1 Tax=Tropicimonas sp. IMCC34011 TaxID=2248759 RepID=UPI000E251117|nr:ABC transporter ATP-binding protein [Tropicimonas sp. IMCC34011]